MEMYVLFPAVNAMLLLVLSFFVLVGVSKTDSKTLKSFGRILTVILWAIAACLIAVTLYLNYSGAKGKTLRYKLMPYKMYHRVLKPN